MQEMLRNTGSTPLGQTDALEEGTVTHSSILAWRTPRTKETAWLQSMGVVKSRTQLKQLSMHACRKNTYTWEPGAGTEEPHLSPPSVTSQGALGISFLQFWTLQGWRAWSPTESRSCVKGWQQSLELQARTAAQPLGPLQSKDQQVRRGASVLAEIVYPNQQREGRAVSTR